MIGPIPAMDGRNMTEMAITPTMRNAPDVRQLGGAAGLDPAGSGSSDTCTPPLGKRSGQRPLRVVQSCSLYTCGSFAAV
jgi:hypothetical protein